MTSLTYPGGTTIYILQVVGVPFLQYTINNGMNISILNFPVTITNTETNLGVVKVEFATDITLSSTNDYFLCNSSHIQFGSTSLKSDGSRPVIKINIDNYDGFIENGTTSLPGNSNIYVYNLVVDGSGHSLQISAGWIGKKYFGNQATNNYFINCSSNGDLPEGAIGSGGIVGSHSGQGPLSSMFIYGCSRH